jgi:hypothetical protein
MSDSIVPAALVIAHPGHELMIHHWLETERPVVYALTDGSGSQGKDRLAGSRTVIDRAGARIGAVFGWMPDRAWYEAILARDASPFISVSKAIAEDMADTTETMVVDAVEYFNPMHDLAAVVGVRVASLVAARRGRAIRVLDYPIERPDLRSGEPFSSSRLDPAATMRKIAAALGYVGVAQEVERVVASTSDERFAVERFDRFDISVRLPPKLDAEPFYESYGRRQIAAGRYRDLITYAGHVRPIVETLLAS